MRKQLTSSARAKGFSIATFLIGLGIISITDHWWPEIALAIGAALAVRQLFLRKYYEMSVSIVLFAGIFIANKYTLPWKMVWPPVIFFIAALFVLMREYVDAKLASEDQQEEDLNHEIEEENEKNLPS